MPVVWQSSINRVAPENVPALRSEVLEETFASAYEEQPFLPGGIISRGTELTQAGGGLNTGSILNFMLNPSRRAKFEAILPRPGLARVSAADANKRAKDEGVDLEFDNDTTNEALQILINRKRKEMHRAEIFNRSPGGFGLGAQRFALAAGTTLADPAGMALNFVPVVPEMRYARWLASARGAIGRAGVRTGVGALEGGAGALAYEPVLASAKNSEQADYDATDSLLNVAFGTALGGGIHAIGGGTAEAVRALRGIEQPWAIHSPLRDAMTAGRVLAEKEPVTITPEMIERGGKKLDEAVDAALGAGSRPVVRAEPVVRHQLDPDTGEHVATISLDGKQVGVAYATEKGPYLQMDRIDVDDTIQGEGLGQAMMIDLARQADERGLTLASSASSVSPDQVRVYEALARRGFQIERNPLAVVNPTTKNLVSHDPREPVFKVGPTPKEVAPRRPLSAAERVAAASHREREAALRIATNQLAHGEDVNVAEVFQGSDGRRAAPDAVEPAPPESKAVSEPDKQREDELAELEEASQLEETLTEQQARLLGMDPDEGMVAAENRAQRIEQWAQAAELAQICLVRGG